MEANDRGIPVDAIRIERPEWVVRPYAPGDEAGILALFHAVWPPPLAQRRTLRQWNWQYRDAPLGHRIIVGEDRNGRIIVHYATLPLRLWLDGRVVVGGVGVDSMVHPDVRRGLQREGVFLTAARAYYEVWGGQAPNAWNWGFANRQAQRIGVGQLGYLTIEDGVPALFVNRFDRTQRLQRTSEELAVNCVTRFSPDVDELWQRCRATQPFAVIRDHAYLSWRFVDCPLPRLCVEVRDQRRLRGVAVLQPWWQAQPILAVIEYFAEPSDAACLAAVLHHAATVAAAHEQVRIELWLPPRSQPFAQALALGMRSEPTECHLVCRPVREMTEVAAWCARWHYTLGDSDIV